MIALLENLAHQLYDVEGIIRWGGLLMLVVIIFAETGLMVGFFLPGDSLLVTAGVFSAAGHLELWTLLAAVTAAAIVGDQVGYWIGYRAGPLLFRREDSLLFKRRHLLRAHAFYERHGGKTIILARFMPIIRTFAPVVAGMGQMQYRRYTLYNVVGGLAWIWSMLFVGYFLGRYIPGIGDHIELVILVVIFVSLLPGIIAWLRSRGRTTEKRAVSDI